MSAAQFARFEDWQSGEGPPNGSRLRELPQPGRDSGRLVDAVDARLLETGECQLQHAAALGGDRHRVDEPVSVSDEGRESAVHGGVPLAPDLVQHDHEAGMAAADTRRSSG